MGIPTMVHVKSLQLYKNEAKISGYEHRHLVLVMSFGVQVSIIPFHSIFICGITN